VPAAVDIFVAEERASVVVRADARKTRRAEKGEVESTRFGGEASGMKALGALQQPFSELSRVIRTL